VESSYSNIVSVPELVPPTVSLTSPANNSNVSGAVSVTANATDNVGVTKVEFYLNGVLQTTDTSTPYVYSWNTASLASGSYTLMAKAYDAAGNIGQSSNVVVTVVNDTIPPTVSLTAPTNNATVSGTVVISANASDNVGVSKVEFYENGNLLSATNVTPYSYSWNTTSVANGSYTLIAKAYDAAGNIGQSANLSVTVSNDTTPPSVTAFSMPITSTSLTVPVLSLIATDNVGVVGFMITSSSTAPASLSSGWTITAPTSFTFTAAGNQTAYAWAKDAAGNISTPKSVSVLIETAPPTVTAFIMPSTSTSLTVPVTSFTANDSVGVAGYLITSTSTVPLASASGWSSSVPTSFTFSAQGTQTAYAWAKDAAGNVSSSPSAKINIDTTPPTVTAFSMPTTSTSLTVPVLGFTATDNVGVTGYMITTNATPPLPSASGWSGTYPTSFTFSAAGVQTAYAWAKDAVGNVSAGISTKTTITLPQTLAIDAKVSAGSATTSTMITTPSFTTKSSNELLVAFISGSSPGTGSNTSVTGVTNTGGALTWTRAVITNAQMGTAEIWWAYSPTPMTGTVTATLNQSVSSRSITLVSFTGTANGANAIGATSSGNSAAGAPTASLVTTRANSWVFGIGNDWSGAVSRTLGSSQTMVNQYLSSSTGDTYWVQRQNSTTPAAGTKVTINDTAPAGDMYNLSIIEIRTP